MKNTILFFFFICLIGSCSSPGSKGPESASDWMDLAGTTAYASNQWMAALDSAIAIDPNLAEAWYRKAVWNLRREEYEVGMACLNRAVDLDPISYVNYRGWVKMIQLKDYESAAKDFESAVQLKAFHDPVISGSAYSRWGLVLKEIGDYEGAVEKFDTLIAIQGPEKVLVYNYVHRGLAHQALGNIDLALEDFDRAIENWEKCPEAYYYKAQLLQQIGDKEQSCKNLHRAFLYVNLIRSNPTRPYLDQIYEADLETLFDQVCR